MYPFSISVGEHVPLNIGTGRIFSDKSQKWIFQRQGYSGWGCRGKVHPKCFDLLKSGQNPRQSRQKWHPTLFDFKKWCATFAKNTLTLFLEVTPKRVLHGRKFVSKSHTKLFGQVGRLWAKILRMLKNLPACTVMSRGGQKYICRGAKSGKILFSPLETKKTTFFAKHLMGKCQISISWGPCPPTPMSLKLFIAERLRKITNIYLAY